MKYVTPEMIVELFDCTDVIRTSLTTEDAGGNTDGEDWGIQNGGTGGNNEGDGEIF